MLSKAATTIDVSGDDLRQPKNTKNEPGAVNMQLCFILPRFLYCPSFITVNQTCYLMCAATVLCAEQRTEFAKTLEQLSRASANRPPHSRHIVARQELGYNIIYIRHTCKVQRMDTIGLWYAVQRNSSARPARRRGDAPSRRVFIFVAES